MFNLGEKEVISQIAVLLSQAETLYYTLPVETQEKVNDYHNEGATLAFCLRWGNTGAEELLAQDAKDNQTKFKQYVRTPKAVG